MIRYDINQGVTKIKTTYNKIATRTAIGVTAIIAGLTFALAPAGASSATIYNNIPSPQPPNVPSVGFEATSTSEFGGQVGLAGSERTNPTVTVLMSSWACQSGGWTSGCTTTPGATFTHDITLNVYNVGSSDSVGSLITTKTENFTMPYRPSSDNCGGDPTAWTASDNSCNHGLAFPISFDLTGTTLPDHVILGVAYNTSHYGANPIGTSGPYDSLNVGTSGAPTVGTALPTANDAYQNSSWNGAYCDNGSGGTGTFRLDAGCWTGFLPAFKITAPQAAPTDKDQCKKDGWKNYGTTFKNQGDCVSFVATHGKNQPSGH
jgi:hypothetical protein